MLVFNTNQPLVCTVKSACSWTNTLLLFHYLTVCQLTHLFIPLRNSNSLTPSGTLKTRITVPWESQYQIRSQYKKWSCSTKRHGEDIRLNFFRSTGQTGSWSIECDSSHMTGVSQITVTIFLQLIKWRALSCNELRFPLKQTSMGFLPYSKHHTEWFLQRWSSWICQIWVGMIDRKCTETWQKRAISRSLWPRIDIAHFDQLKQ